MTTLLFINPPTSNNRKITRNCDCASESKGNYLLQPFDFLYLTSKFDQSTTFHFIDAVAECLNNEEVLERIKTLKPTHIVTAIVDLCWDEDLKFIADVRSLFNNSIIFSFGDALVEENSRVAALEHLDGIIDNAFLFDISETFNSTRESLKSFSTSGLSNTKFRPKVDKAPQPITFKHFPKHEYFSYDRYRWPFARFKKYSSIATNWGCPYSCSYCIDSIFPFYYRKAEDFENELAHLSSQGIRELVVTDKSFGNPRENTLQILKLLQKYKFSWSTYIHPKQCDPTLLNEMKLAGCHTIIIGIESNNSDHLKAFKRSTNTDIILTAIKNAKAISLDVCGDFLIGLPEQKYEDVLDLIYFSTTLNLDYASFNIVAPLPGSFIKQTALQDGRLKPDDHHFDSVGSFNVLPTSYLNEHQLRNLRKLANRKFYMRPEIVFKKFKSIVSFEHLMIQFQEGWQLLTKR